MTVAVTLAPEGPPSVTPQPTPRAPSELEGLLGATIGGDRRARERLLAEIHPLVLRYCRGRLGRQETVIGSAEDVAQDICLAVIAALATYTLKGLSFRSFVYAIAAHKVTDAFRAIVRDRVEPMAEPPETAVTYHGPEQRVLAAEDAEKLRKLLDTLNERQREVLVLRIAVGLSAEETAQAIQSTPGAVRVTQHRALNRLRATLIGSGLESPRGAAPPTSTTAASEASPRTADVVVGFVGDVGFVSAS